MKITAAPSLIIEDHACLETIADLGTAITQALVAVSEDSLEKLEEALWRQQVLCATLKRSLRDLSTHRIAEASLEKLVSAFQSLQALNAGYAELLRQASISTDLLYQVCLGYQERTSSQNRHTPSLLPLEV